MKEIEKLELKHLSPYLPYGLKIHGESSGFNLDMTLATMSDCELLMGIDCVLKEQQKPILRPLSDYHNENIYEDFIYLFGENDDYVEALIDGRLLLKDMPKYIMDWLFENHFDVFGLIEKGLAVDINTIKK